MRLVDFVLACTVGVFLAPAVISAQSAAGRASLAGVVRDSSGGVLPGVTVEASSPSLIEKVRLQITDGEGRYRIVDLPSGRYTVSFTLPGFSTVRREGITLEGTFAATIDVALSVGQLTETVTVTGESPIVNVQSATQEVVINRELLTQLPIARDWFAVAALVPGMVTSGTQDIGGLTGTRAITMNFSNNGGRGIEGRLQIDGLPTGGTRFGGTGSGTFLPDITNAQEVVVTSSGGLGDAETGGPSINVIPRAGGNTRSGSFYYNFSKDSLQGNNITDELRAQNPALGTSAGNIIKMQDVNGAFGGPIARDRLWYFAGVRHTILDKQIPGFFFNKNRNVNIATGAINGIPFKVPAPYEPDLDRPGLDDTRQYEGNIRLTYQLSQRNKLTGAYTQQYRLIDYEGGAPPGGSARTAPEATATGNANPQTIAQVTWQNVWSNRLLFESSVSRYTLASGGFLRDDNDTSVLRVTDSAAVIPALSSTPVNMTYGSQSSLSTSPAYSRNFYYVNRWRAKASYVTGGHSLRIGHDGSHFNHYNRLFTNDTGLSYGLRGGVPQSVTVTAVSGFSTPYKSWTQNLGFFADDQWTMGRLTLQGALRFEYATSGHPEQVYGPSNLAVNLQPTAITFPAGNSVWGFKDLQPRAAATLDVFGDGKTALKFNVGEYVEAIGLQGIWSQNNPTVVSLVNQYTRSWIDTNNNWTPDCDLTNGALQGTVGTQPFGAAAGTVLPENAAADQCNAPAGGIPTFGSGLSTTTWDHDALGGWNTRPNDWQIGVGVQREILPRVSLEVSYRRRWLGNFSFTNNYGTGPGCGPGADERDCLTAADYTPFSIVAPLDSRLPGGGGYVVDGLYNINRAGIGTQNYVTLADSAHRRTSVFNGIDVNVAARLAGLTLNGGWQHSKEVDDDCRQIVDNPAGLRGCRVDRPWVYQARGSVSYITPAEFGWLRDLNVSGTFNSTPAVIAAANYQVPNTLIRDGYCVGDVCSTGLGRLPTGGSATGVTTTNLLDPGRPTYMGQQINADLHVGRIVHLGRHRANLGVDIYNFLNFSSVLSRNFTVIYPNTPAAPAFQQPLSVMPARFMKFTVQYDF